MVYPYHGLLLNKKEQTIDASNSLDEFQRNYAKRKKTVSKGYIPHDSIVKMTRSQRWRGDKIGLSGRV